MQRFRSRWTAEGRYRPEERASLGYKRETQKQGVTSLRQCGRETRDKVARWFSDRPSRQHIVARHPKGDLAAFGAAGWEAAHLQASWLCWRAADVGKSADGAALVGGRLGRGGEVGCGEVGDGQAKRQMGLGAGTLLSAPSRTGRVGRPIRPRTLTVNNDRRSRKYQGIYLSIPFALARPSKQ